MYTKPNPKITDLIDNTSKWASIVSIPLAILLINRTTSIIVAIFFGLTLLIVARGFYIRLTSHDAITKRHEDDIASTEERYENYIYETLESIKSYNTDYNNGMINIKNGEINTLATLDDLLCKLNTHIEKMLSKMLKERVSVCIKYLDEESRLENFNYREWKLKTIGRSTSSEAARRRKDSRSVFVSENSDFLSIFEDAENGAIEAFVAPNLIELKRTWLCESPPKEYLNSTHNYLKYYKSTIVYPIQINTDLTSQLIKEQMSRQSKAHYHIVGFLCMDSKKVFDAEDKDEIFPNAAALLESFSDDLYPLLEQFILMQIDHPPLIIESPVNKVTI